MLSSCTLVCSGFKDSILILVGNASPIKAHEPDMRCHFLTFDPEAGLRADSVGLDAKITTAAPDWDSEDEEDDEEMGFPRGQTMVNRAATIETSLQLQGPYITAVDRSNDYGGRDIREIYVVASKGSLHSHLMGWDAERSRFRFDGGG